MYFSKLKERHFDRISKPCPVKIFVAACDQGRISSSPGCAAMPERAAPCWRLRRTTSMRAPGLYSTPHYRSMGDLYGSEYWTYTLPRRVGQTRALELTQSCQPIGTRAAKEMGSEPGRGDLGGALPHAPRRGSKFCQAACRGRQEHCPPRGPSEGCWPFCPASS
jgi:hypothetical protein